MWGVKTDLTGQTFGKLFVLGESDDRQRGYTCWRVQCDCGSPEKVYSTFALKSRKGNHVHSCGCLSNKKPVGVAARNRVWHDYRNNAKRRKVGWNLTDEQFNRLTKSDCHYCGRSPRSIQKNKYTGPYTYNGIDRKDNLQGYCWENVVPCCKPCNWAKGKMTYDEFMLWIGDLVRHQSQKSTSNLLVRSKTASGV